MATFIERLVPVYVYVVEDVEVVLSESDHVDVQHSPDPDAALASYVAAPTDATPSEVAAEPTPPEEVTDPEADPPVNLARDPAEDVSENPDAVAVSENPDEPEAAAEEVQPAEEDAPAVSIGDEPTAPAE